MIVAVDGPVAAGKGTLAQRLAAHFGFAYLDTGNLYRAVADRLIEAGQADADEPTAAAVATSLTESDLASPRLRREQVGRVASLVAAMPAVRTALLDYQRNFAGTPPGGAPGAVLDGRDIGTAVCPDADVKLFVTANSETRAERRTRQLLEAGEPTPYAQVFADLQARDARDAIRTRQAADAHLLDTTNLSIDSAFKAACQAIIKAMAEKA